VVGLTSSGTVRLVTRLEQAGYVEREPGRDARVSLVRLTPAGRRAAHRVSAARADVLQDALADLGAEERELRRGRLADFGLIYEAYHLGEDRYFSDARFDERGRRWHPELLDLHSLRPGERVVVLVHPCHWDQSLGAKYARVVQRLARRALRPGF
jgi:hypothetical protein